MEAREASAVNALAQLCEEKTQNETEEERDSARAMQNETMVPVLLRPSPSYGSEERTTLPVQNADIGIVGNRRRHTSTLHNHIIEMGDPSPPTRPTADPSRRDRSVQVAVHFAVGRWCCHTFTRKS